MKPILFVPILLTGLALAGCDKKPSANPPSPAAPKTPEVGEAAPPSGSVGGASKRAIDDAKAKLDAAQKREAAGAAGVE